MLQARPSPGLARLAWHKARHARAHACGTVDRSGGAGGLSAPRAPWRTAHTGASAERTGCSAVHSRPGRLSRSCASVSALTQRCRRLQTRPWRGATPRGHPGRGWSPPSRARRPPARRKRASWHASWSVATGVRSNKIDLASHTRIRLTIVLRSVSRRRAFTLLTWLGLEAVCLHMPRPRLALCALLLLLPGPHVSRLGTQAAVHVYDGTFAPLNDAFVFRAGREGMFRSHPDDTASLPPRLRTPPAPHAPLLVQEASGIANGMSNIRLSEARRTRRCARRSSRPSSPPALRLSSFAPRMSRRGTRTRGRRR